MNSDHTHKRRWHLKLSLWMLLAIVIAAAGVIVAVGYSLYLHNPDRNYDVGTTSGSNTTNQALNVKDADTQSDTTSPVDATDTKSKIDYLSEEVAALNNINTFGQNDLSDQNIQLAPASQPSL